MAFTMWKLSITTKWREQRYEHHASRRRLEYHPSSGSPRRNAPRGVHEAAGNFDQRPRSGTARIGHPHQPDRQRASRDHRRYSIASGAPLRHERRFLDEYSEGLRIAFDPAQVVEDDRETGPAAHGRSITHGTRLRTPA